MRAVQLLFVLFCLLGLEASALSFPTTVGTTLPLEDSAAKTVSVAPSRLEPRKRPTFFERMGKRSWAFSLAMPLPDRAKPVQNPC